MCWVGNEREALDVCLAFHGQRQAPGHWCLGQGVRVLSLLGVLFPGTCLQGMDFSICLVITLAFIPSASTLVPGEMGSTRTT